MTPIQRTIRAALAVLALLYLGSPDLATGSEMTTRLTLEEAVVISVRHNVSIALERIGLARAVEDENSAIAFFDQTLDSEISMSQRQSPSSTSLAGSEVALSDSLSGEVSINKPTEAGTEYSMAVKTSRDSSNSSFTSLNPVYQTSLSLEVTHPLLKGSSTQANRWKIVTALGAQAIGTAQVEAQVSEIVTQVHEAYWELVYRRGRLKAEQESLERARDLEQRVRIQVKVGSMAELAIIEAEASSADRERLVIEAQNNLEKSADDLLALLNPPTEDNLWQNRPDPVDTPSVDPAPVDHDESVRHALEARPELVAARMQVENAEATALYQTDQAKDQLDVFGSLSLSGVRGDTRVVNGLEQSTYSGGIGDSYSDALSAKGYDYLVGLRFSAPIGSRSQDARRALAKLDVDEARLRLHDIERQVIFEVRNAIREVENGRKQVVAARAARTLAEQRLQAEITKFEAGVSAPFTALEYQKELTLQQSNELLAVANLRKAVARYWRAVGTTLSMNGIAPL